MGVAAVRVCLALGILAFFSATASDDVSLFIRPSENSLQCVSTGDSPMYLLGPGSPANKTLLEAKSTYSGPQPASTLCPYHANQPCSPAWDVKKWITKSSLEMPFLPLDDQRWEDLPLLFTDGSYRNVHIFKLPAAPILHIGVSVLRSYDSFVLLCDGPDQSTSNCYWVIINGWRGVKSALRHCESGLPSAGHATGDCATLRTEHLGRVGAVDDWLHVSIAWNQQESSLKVSYRNNQSSYETFLEFNHMSDVTESPTKPAVNVTHVILRSYYKNIYWRLHKYDVLTFNDREEKTVGLFSQPFTPRAEFCLSFLYYTSPGSQIKVFLSDYGTLSVGETEISSQTVEMSWTGFRSTMNISNEHAGKPTRLHILGVLNDTDEDALIAIDAIRECQPGGDTRSLSWSGADVHTISCQSSYQPDVRVKYREPSAHTTESAELIARCAEFYDSCNNTILCGGTACICLREFGGKNCDQAGLVLNEQPILLAAFLDGGRFSVGAQSLIWPDERPRVVIETREQCNNNQGSRDGWTSDSRAARNISFASGVMSFQVTGLKSKTSYEIRVALDINSDWRDSDQVPTLCFNTTCRADLDVVLVVKAGKREAVLSTQPGESPDSCSLSWYTALLVMPHATSRDLGLSSDQNLPHSISNLTPSTEYSIMFQGPDGITFIRRFTTEHDDSSQVVNLRVEKRTSTSLSVGWTPPDALNGVLRHYTVTCQYVGNQGCPRDSEIHGEPDNQNTTTTTTTTDTFVLLTSLRPYSRYDVTVRATTVEEGPMSTIHDHTDVTELPQVAPTNVHVTYVSAISLTLMWSSPPCSDLQGPIAKTAVSVTGVSNTAFKYNERFSGTGNMLYVMGFEHFSTYTVDLLYERPDGRVNPSLAVTTTFTTKPGVTAHSISHPCQPSPCGPHSQCGLESGYPVCTCLIGYLGAPPSCRACALNSDCDPDKACFLRKCVDPCPGRCGKNAGCEVVNHLPTCSCPEGFQGNAAVGCFKKEK